MHVATKACKKMGRAGILEIVNLKSCLSPFCHPYQFAHKSCSCNLFPTSINSSQFLFNKIPNTYLLLMMKNSFRKSPNLTKNVVHKIQTPKTFPTDHGKGFNFCSFCNKLSHMIEVCFKKHCILPYLKWMYLSKTYNNEHSTKRNDQDEPK